jgi:hypothetical protein
MDLNLQQQLHRFMAEVSNGNIEICNEFSIQFELAIFHFIQIQYKIEQSWRCSYESRC